MLCGFQFLPCRSVRLYHKKVVGKRYIKRKWLTVSRANRLDGNCNIRTAELAGAWKWHWHFVFTPNVTLSSTWLIGTIKKSSVYIIVGKYTYFTLDHFSENLKWPTFSGTPQRSRCWWVELMQIVIMFYFIIIVL